MNSSSREALCFWPMRSDGDSRPALHPGCAPAVALPPHSERRHCRAGLSPWAGLAPGIWLLSPAPQQPGTSRPQRLGRRPAAVSRRAWPGSGTPGAQCWSNRAQCCGHMRATGRVSPPGALLAAAHPVLDFPQQEGGGALSARGAHGDPRVLPAPGHGAWGSGQTATPRFAVCMFTSRPANPSRGGESGCV